MFFPREQDSWIKLISTLTLRLTLKILNFILKIFYLRNVICLRLDFVKIYKRNNQVTLLKWFWKLSHVYNTINQSIYRYYIIYTVTFNLNSTYCNLSMSWSIILIWLEFCTFQSRNVVFREQYINRLNFRFNYLEYYNFIIGLKYSFLINSVRKK